ncbi:predicted protein [Naegleria gruberi]|uniref:Predicted protein n=1 Tax=Naegleria gruberi TaxID=5762 RepID=D2VY01_NAEGR|nr:uncharacterized protein NAEGRDRAFT_59545 [Naegleria gruberi]EFC38236.1 predicted protein [Naegleria gruberi]|eukprot:XP_002670980.1 predicted protein [Naegleria gruberi strain NEG-M]
MSLNLTDLYTQIPNSIPLITLPDHDPNKTAKSSSEDLFESTASFAQSFNPHTEMEQAKEFFNEWGFVVFNSILNQEQINNSISDIFTYLESGHYNASYTKDFMKDPLDLPKSNVSHLDKSTWTNKNWPAMKEEGILGSPPVFTKQAMENRENENVYHAFKEIIGNEDLWVSMDRYGFFRPTVENEEWKSRRNIHLDRNPWNYVYNKNPIEESFPREYYFLPEFCGEFNEGGNYKDGIVKVQGLINFVDNRAQDGGFIIVPKFNKIFKEWTQLTRNTLANKYVDSSFVVLSRQEKELFNKAVRIPLKAGDMLIWDICMPHGSAPNESDRYRLCQFLKMFPSYKPTTKQGNSSLEIRRKIIRKALERYRMNPTPLGNKLFGLE